MPKLKKLDLVSNKLQVDFILPRTNDCIIEFELLEKDPDKKEYSPNSVKYKYAKEKSKLSLNEDQFIFDNPISSKYKLEYKVKAKIIKQCLNEIMTREITFEQKFIVPYAFPRKLKFYSI